MCNPTIIGKKRTRSTSPSPQPPPTQVQKNDPQPDHPIWNGDMWVWITHEEFLAYKKD